MSSLLWKGVTTVFETIVKELLTEFGVDLWKRGAKDFIDLVIALKVDMGFGGQGLYDLVGECRRLAKARRVPLKWFYADMRTALLPMTQGGLERLERFGIAMPRRRSAPALAVEVARWLWSIEVS